MTDQQRQARAATNAMLHITTTLCNEGASREGADAYVFHLFSEYPNEEPMFLVAKATPQAMYRRYLAWWKPHRAKIEAQNIDLWHVMTEAGYNSPNIDKLLSPL